MQQPTKQELRDRIAELEKRENMRFDSLVNSIKVWKKRALYGEIAAYALLATLAACVYVGVIL